MHKYEISALILNIWSARNCKEISVISADFPSMPILQKTPPNSRHRYISPLWTTYHRDKQTNKGHCNAHDKPRQESSVSQVGVMFTPTRVQLNINGKLQPMQRSDTDSVPWPSSLLLWYRLLLHEPAYRRQGRAEAISGAYTLCGRCTRDGASSRGGRKGCRWRVKGILLPGLHQVSSLVLVAWEHGTMQCTRSM